MEQNKFWAMRTDKNYPTEIMEDIKKGVLRQGWGGSPEQDLRKVAEIWNWHGGKRSDLSEKQELTVRHFAFLGLDEPGMMRTGDIVLVPNLPDRSKFLLCRLGPKSYEYSIHSDTGDHGHIRHVELLTPDGVVKYSEAVSPGLHATLRTPMRLWSLESYRDDMEHLLASIKDYQKIGIEFGYEQRVAQLRQDALDRALQAAEMVQVGRVFEGVGWEYLLGRVLGDLFQIRVEHTGGRNEQGADLVIRVQQPFSDDELLVVIQVKHHSGITGERAIDQLRTAIQTRRSQGAVAMAVLATTGNQNDALRQAAKKLEDETSVRVVICAAQDLERLVRRGLLLSALKDSAIETKAEP